MISKEELAELLDDSGREDAMKKIEEEIDESIRERALDGHDDVYLLETSLHHLGNVPMRSSTSWILGKFSETSKQKIIENLLELYRDNGYDIEWKQIDLGLGYVTDGFYINNLRRTAGLEDKFGLHIKQSEEKSDEN